MVDVQKLDFFVYEDYSLRQVMVCIDKTAKGIALVVDETFHLLATITDGDIRRAILEGISLDALVSVLIERKANSRYPQPITAPVDTDKMMLLKLMQEHTVHQLPLLNHNGQVVDLITADELLPQETPSLQAVVMAGGFGSRLSPLTDDLPKPMLPVGDRPLMEFTIQQLRQAGVHKINVTTHYMSEKIVEHFGDGRKFGVEINYVSEDQPLGTAGAISLMEMPEEPLLVINGDILTQIDFRAMLKFHHEHQADLTVAVRQYDVQVPYGVLECDGVQVKQLREKPNYSFFVNAGIYLLQPSAHSSIPSRKRFDMTDLIEKLINAGRTVASFPIVEYWLDIGQHTDYQQAQEDIREGRFSS